MTRNTKEVALIQIRSGKLSEMPKALHQSEFGLAKDANRLFIGNAANPALKNREIFPYQNLELLTEYSELKDYFKYSYENNITSISGDPDVTRLELKEFLPIVVSCHTEPTYVHQGNLNINGTEILIEAGSDIYDIVSAINSYSNETNTYATVFPGTRVITFICTKNNLDLSGSNPEILEDIGYIPESYDISMPVRKVTEKLDDTLHISDFGIKGNGENVSNKIFNALVEVYKNYPDNQFYRNVMFPAGTYEYNTINDDPNARYFTPFPIISNLHIHGEGIDRTILNNSSENTLIYCIDDEFYAEYDDSSYGKGDAPSNILIEDMTFSGSSSELARLIGCSDVTFNRVKFSGDNTTNLIEISGKNESENVIKLELNNGTLTLKAGSKVYIPNGFEQDGVTPKFNEFIIENDISNHNPALERDKSFVTLNSQKNDIIFYLPQDTYSGDTIPTLTRNHAIWYDTANNVIKVTSDYGSTWQDGCPLPIGLCSSTTSDWTSIDQVFNGCGYINSVIFALPGLTGIIPNGKFDNGLLNNIIERIENVQIIDMALSNAGQNRYCLVNNEGMTGGNNFYYDVPSENLLEQEATYLSDENRIYRYGVAVHEIYDPQAFLIATCTLENGKITSFNKEVNFLPTKCEANNITFNECIFENADNGIIINEYSKNININNCVFRNIKQNAIKIGSDNDIENGPVYGINLDTNTFENISGQYVIWLGKSAKYVSVHQSIFDQNVIERSGNTLPYRDYEADDRKNFIDTLDPNTDEKKLLKFHFTQPKWEYINYLVNTNGDTVLTVDGQDSDITADNGLNIVEDQNGIDIRSVKDGNVTLSMNNESNLKLGFPTKNIDWTIDTHYSVNDKVDVDGVIYSCLLDHTSVLTTFEDDLLNSVDQPQWEKLSTTQIIIDKILQLNDHMISNKDGSKNIIIEPATNKVIEIQQTDTTSTNYEDKIVNQPNAVPNVAFVKNYSSNSLIKHISFNDISNIDVNGNLLIGEFPTNQYGDNIHVTNVTVNIRSPFYKVTPYMTVDSPIYENGYAYYKGDVIQGTLNNNLRYAVILETHFKSAADTFSESNTKIKIIPTTYINDVKYIDIVGSTLDSEYTFTKTCHYDYVQKNYIFDYVDIQKNNMFGYNCNNDYRPLITYQSGDIIGFQDKNYCILSTDPTTTSLDLHDSEYSRRLYDEGYVYKFDEDQNSDLESIKYNVTMEKINHSYTINYAGGKIYIKLYDENKALVTSSNVSTKLLNPAGDMIVKIDFVKEEL